MEVVLEVPASLTCPSCGHMNNPVEAYTLHRFRRGSIREEKCENCGETLLTIMGVRKSREHGAGDSPALRGNMAKYRVVVKYPTVTWKTIEAKNAAQAKAIVQDLMEQKQALSDYEEPQPTMAARRVST